MNDFYTLTPEQQAERLHDLAAEALKQWGIGKTASIELIKHRENAVFSVADQETGSRYALRIHRHGYHSDAALLSELQWMNALTDNGITTPSVIPSQNGELYTKVSIDSVPEARQCDLLGWVNGAPLGAIDGDLATDPDTLIANYHTVGVLAGRIHNQSENWQLPQGFSRHAWDEDGLIGEDPLWGRFWELETLTSEQLELLQKAREKTREQLQAFGYGKDRYGLIHADLLPENLLVTDDIIRIIDFDDSGFGWHLFEFATSLFFHLGEDHFDATFNSMIEGYRTVRELPDSHLEMMPTFFMLRGLVYLGWAHTRKETEIAQAMTGEMIEAVTYLATEYLAEEA